MDYRKKKEIFGILLIFLPNKLRPYKSPIFNSKLGTSIQKFREIAF